MRTASALITLLTLIILIVFIAAVGFGEEIDADRAARASGSLLSEIARLRNDPVFPGETLRDAVPGRVVTVHHPVTLEPSYGVVPVRDAGGALVGIVGVDVTGERWQWCSFSYPHREFPVMSAEAATRRLRARLERLGLTGDANDGARNANRPILIQGCDKRLYWHLRDSRGGTWLIDAMRDDAEVLGPDDEVLRSALTPAEAMIRPGGNDILRESGEAGFPLLAETPSAYNIPGVPYHFQITSWYCGPAGLQMVMDYWGEEVNQDDIADVANDVVDVGTFSDDMRRAAHFSGMSACVQNPSLMGYNERQLGYACMEADLLSNPGQKLKNTVYENYPVFILTWYSPTHTAGHYRVVKGWDDSLGVFIIHDPWYDGSLAGPDLIMTQAMLLDDLWAYSGYWSMVACPWELTPDLPSSPAAGDTFSVDLQVYYPGPTRYSGRYPCSGCQATIKLPAGLSLAGGSPTQSLPLMASGDTTQVTWDVVATSEGDYSIAFQAQGILTGVSGSYPSYSDSIGGHASETMSVGSPLLADWGAEEQLTDGAGSSLLCAPGGRAMVVGSNGEVHLVWSDTEGGTSDVYYMKQSGGTWGTPVKLNDLSGFATTPCIAEGPDGRLHVAWVDDRHGNHEIYYKYWDSAGGWSADERVTAYSEVDYCPAIAAGDTAVYLAWERRMGSAFRVSAVHFAERTDGGWSAPVDVDAAPARDSYHPSLTYGPDGILYLAYERQTANDPNELEKIVMKSWDGLSWSGRTGISQNIGFSRNPCIAAGPDTTLHVVWQDADGGYGAIYYAYYDGSAWQPVIQVSPASVEATTPSVAVDGSGVAHIVWSDHRHRDTEIYYGAYEDQVLVDGLRISNGPGHSTVPTVAAGGAGGLCVVWSDLRNGTADLYFRAGSDQSGVQPEVPLASGERVVWLAAPAPNPFSSTTRITLVLARQAPAIVQVFDIHGRLVGTLADGSFGAGTHSISWDGSSSTGAAVAPGIYFIRCESPIGRDVRRVVIAR